MTRLTARNVFCCAVLMCLAAAAGAQVMTAPEPPDLTIVQKLDEQVPLDLEFVNELGNTVHLSEYVKDKPVVLALVYYECPMLCGEVLQGMLTAFNNLEFTIGKEFTVVTVSFNPKEQPELAKLKKSNTLEAYKDEAAGRDWHFLTSPSEANVRKLADAVGFQYLYLPSVDEYAHPSGIIVLTPQGRVSKYFYGIEYSPQDLRLGLVEASQGRIGTLVDELKLLCFQYDPASGSYGFVIMAALRLAGLVTVGFLAVFIGAMLLQERLRRSRSNTPVPQP